MKAYVFKMNGYPIDLDTLNNCLMYESQYCDLFVEGKVECDDCSGEDSSDIITIEEIEVGE